MRATRTASLGHQVPRERERVSWTSISAQVAPERSVSRMRARPLVIASAAKQSRVFPHDESGLLRCARNDGGKTMQLLPFSFRRIRSMAQRRTCHFGAPDAHQNSTVVPGKPRRANARCGADPGPILCGGRNARGSNNAPASNYSLGLWVPGSARANRATLRVARRPLGRDDSFVC